MHSVVCRFLTFSCNYIWFLSCQIGVRRPFRQRVGGCWSCCAMERCSSLSHFGSTMKARNVLLPLCVPIMFQYDSVKVFWGKGALHGSAKV